VLVVLAVALLAWLTPEGVGTLIRNGWASVSEELECTGDDLLDLVPLDDWS
jgi:hypothetical protein